MAVVPFDGAGAGVGADAGAGTLNAERAGRAAPSSIGRIKTSRFSPNAITEDKATNHMKQASETLEYIG